MTNTNQPHIGPQMRAAVDYVEAHPGCSIRAVAIAITPCPVPAMNWAYGYNPVHRAIDAGLINADQPNGWTYRLTVPTFIGV